MTETRTPSEEEIGILHAEQRLSKMALRHEVECLRLAISEQKESPRRSNSRNEGSSNRFSRSQLFKVGLAGAAGLAASDLMSPPGTAHAADGDTLIMGSTHYNDSATGTTISVTANSSVSTVFNVDATASQNTPPVTAIYGKSSAGGVGAQGTSLGSAGSYVVSCAGVFGQTDTGFGVLGFAGNGSATPAVDLAALGNGNLLLSPQIDVGPPSSGLHTQGERVVDSNGTLYTCVVGNATTPGTWRAVGNLITFPAGHRIYANPSVPSGTTVSAIDATTNIHGIATGVPQGAQSVYCAVQSYQSGVMTLFADAAPDPGKANWSGVGTSGILNLLYILVPLASYGQLQFHIYFTGSVYIDAWGYLQ
jgi:hypothetical protein